MLPDNPEFWIWLVLALLGIMDIGTRLREITKAVLEVAEALRERDKR